MNKVIFKGILIHPGYGLKEALDDRNISKEELALITGYSINYISSVIDGKKDISVKFANRLEYALGIPAHFWINLMIETYNKRAKIKKLILSFFFLYTIIY